MREARAVDRVVAKSADIYGRLPLNQVLIRAYAGGGGGGGAAVECGSTGGGGGGGYTGGAGTGCADDGSRLCNEQFFKLQSFDLTITERFYCETIDVITVHSRF